MNEFLNFYVEKFKQNTLLDVGITILMILVLTDAVSIIVYGG